MSRKKECVAMLLAGGQGSRLYVLTQNVAKPAVPFGGKYRIIDFPLSNCVNSGIDTVGVLTQYEPHALNSYLANGQAWDLDRLYGGVYVLPPYQKGKNSEWYKGTANAIYQNIGFTDQYDPEYVLILSGDHIYKMDYDKMLEEHKKKNADATIAVLNVSLEEASRFGIMNCHPDGTIYEFEEKPKNPKSTLASMGIYIFSYKKLRQYLIEDEADPNSSNDFGHDIIPKMLANGENMQTYQFEGYWKDVGTIASLWEANMDLLNPESGMVIGGDWSIYARNVSAPPHFAGASSTIRHSMVSEGCEIDGDVNESIIFPNVSIAKGATVDHSVLMPGAIVEAGAVVEYAIVAESAVIKAGAVVGAKPEADAKPEIAVIAAEVEIGNGQVVKAGDMVGKD
ncbi:MAG: glucose-1-phosphate adenylyltransferase [Butyricicoccaceae bacterium]